jgi:hypothetical protein
MTSEESETAADLQRWIDCLSHAAQIGEPLESSGSGAFDTADAQSWGPDRCIPAAALRNVLTCGELTVDPRGLRISGARFREALDLAHIAFPHPLHFKDCVFESLADLRGAALKELSFEGCHTRHVKLEGAQISGDVFVSGMEAKGAVEATGIQIGGQLHLDKARLRNANGNALNLDNAEITGDVCAGGLEADGDIGATGIQIGGQLHLDEARLRNANGNALNLDNAEITGNVSAGGLEADGEIGVTAVYIGGHLDLDKARLRNADGNALSLDNAEITGDVLARGLEADGAVDAAAVYIGGDLNLREATLRKPDGDALSLDNAEITGNVSARSLEADGEIGATGIQIGGQLDLCKARLRNADGNALNLDNAEITDGVSAGGLEAEGAVRAQRANIRGLLHLCEAKLRNADGDALSLDGAEITGDVFAGGLEADGEVDAAGVHIGGFVRLSGAKLHNADGAALNLDFAQVTGGVFGEGLEANGAVHAIGVHIGGRLDFSGAKLRNADGDALNLDFAQVTGGVFAEGLEADGAVQAIGAHVGGQLGLSGAKLRNAHGMALNLKRAEITGDLLAADLEANGEVCAVAVQIRRQIDLSRARLRTAGDRPNSAGEVIRGGCALSLARAEITDKVLAVGLEAQGEVRATGARVGGRLDLREAKLCNRDPDGCALNLESASIKQLTLGSKDKDIAGARGPVDVTGECRLYRAAITDLETDANPPSPLVATGWEVTDIHGPLRSNSAAARRWLKTTTETSVQPWHALANVYERNGEPADARRLRLAAANKVTRQSPSLWTKILRSGYGLLVGYGYYPLMAGFWLVVVVVVGIGIVTANRAHFVPTHDAANTAAIAYPQQTHNPIPTQTRPNPMHYTVSALLPTAVGNATSDWTIGGWVSVALTTLKLIAWVLTALLLAGVTGLLRKE